MKRLLAASLLACAAPAFGAPVDKVLEPGKSHEYCEKLATGDERRYHWKADGPMDFNIHYHVGERVEFPVKRSAMRGDGGTFKARSDQDYCWMWTSKATKPAKLTGSVD
jgi:hypothetical protein